MTSLPQSVKNEFIKRNKNIFYKNQIAKVYHNNVICGWSASPEDILSKDWAILYN